MNNDKTETPVARLLAEIAANGGEISNPRWHGWQANRCARAAAIRTGKLIKVAGRDVWRLA